MARPSTDAAAAIRPLLRVRQVREFSDEPVDSEALDAIVDAARWSGSAGNSQPWRFITIRRVETLRAMGEAGLPHTRALATAMAAVAIVLPEQPGRGISLAYDEGRAAERILIATSFCGLAAGITWLPAEARPAVAQLLGVRPDRFVRTVVAIGHPSERNRRAKSAPGAARLPREQAVLAERWPD